MVRLTQRPETIETIAHMCRHNKRHLKSGLLLQKATWFITTSPTNSGYAAKVDMSMDLCWVVRISPPTLAFTQWS